MNINELTPEQRAQLKAELEAQDKQHKQQRQDAYLDLRAGFIAQTQELLQAAVYAAQTLVRHMDNEGLAFGEIMKEYGQLKKEDQQMLTINDCSFKVEIKRNKIKGFDERANIAATRLLEYLDKWISSSEDGLDNPMYQLAMVLLERNRNGDYDNKAISRLYGMESKFNDPAYSEIMDMFKESNVIEGTRINYYFHKLDSRGIWRRIEPSFNRM